MTAEKEVYVALLTQNRYETRVGSFPLVCRHCLKTKSEHIQGACLFDSTTWDPLTQEEWNTHPKR